MTRLRPPLAFLTAATLAVGTACVLTPDASGDPPREGTREGTSHGTREGTRGGGRDGWGGRPSFREGTRDPDRDVTPEEWAETESFLREHAPRRLEIFRRYAEAARNQETAGRDAEEVEGHGRPPSVSLRVIRVRTHFRVKSLMHLQESDADLFRFAVEQFQLEDRIMGGLLDLQVAEEAGEGDAAERHSRDVDEHVAVYTRNLITERERRVSDLREQLAFEQARLSEDRGRLDEIAASVRTRFERMTPPPHWLTAPATRPAEDTPRRSE